MRLFFLFIIFLTPDYSWAEEAISKISAQLGRHEITVGRFKQEKRIKFLRKPFISEGEFIYRKSTGVVWKTLSPLPSLLLVDENRLLSDQEEQQLPPQFGRIFKALIGGELNLLAEDFDIEADRKKAKWQIRLQPTNAAMQNIIQTIRLMGATDMELLTVEEKNGNSTQITFSRISHPGQLDSRQQADFDRLSP